MDLKRTDINLLVSLEALFVERNVTRAAARLNISQPALSAQLNRLRDIFEDPFLLPSHKGMVPTAKALDLFRLLNLALAHLRNTVAMHTHFSPATTDITFNIACTDYVEAVVLMPLITALQKSAPNARLAVHSLRPDKMRQLLEHGECDLVIGTAETGNESFHTKCLFQQSYVLVARNGHHAINGEISPQQFAALKQVIASPTGGGFHSPVDDAIAAMGLRRSVAFSVASFHLLPQLVASTELVALVPRRLLGNRSSGLDIIELPWLEETFSIDLLCTNGPRGIQLTVGCANLSWRAR